MKKRIFFFLLIYTFTVFSNPNIEKNKRLNNKPFKSKELLDLYKSNHPDKIVKSNYLKIPKIIHQIWLGSDVPEEYYDYIKSWQTFHPDWQYFFWTDENVAQLKLINQESFDIAKNLGMKSDILRLELLNIFGGLYIDTDFLCLKPFDDLHYKYDFYIGTFSGRMILNGLIGCSSGHPLIKKCIYAIDVEKVKKQNDVLSTTGPRLVTKVLINYVKNLPNEKILVLPPKYFYPISNNQKQKNQYLDYVVNETYAVHFWSMSWKKK